MTDEKLKNLIEQLRYKSSPAVQNRMQTSIEDAWTQHEQKLDAPGAQSIWRNIMKNRITFTAVAAVLLIAVIIGVAPWGPSKPAWADIVQPILNAETAIMTIVVGQPGVAPEIKDWVAGNRIRRTVGDFPNISVIDLETLTVMTLEEQSKTAIVINLGDFPSEEKPQNYLDGLRNLLLFLEESEDFETEYLGEHVLESGQNAIGIKAIYDGGELFIWADPQTHAPVQIEQYEGQLQIVCKDIEFDVPMEDSLFSMEIPEGYKEANAELDLSSGSEENFIKGLDLWHQYIGEGYFPEDVRVESYLKSAKVLGMRLEASGMSEEEILQTGMELGKYLLFIRFYQGDGPWVYAGRGVQYGNPETAIFWYKPKDSETFRVIYADLHVEDVAEQDLPEAPEPYDPVPAVMSFGRSITGYVSEEVANWLIQPDGMIQITSTITILQVPDDPSETMSIDLPYGRGKVQSVTLNGNALEFTQIKGKTHEIQMLPELFKPHENTLECIWTIPLEILPVETYGRKVRLISLIPASKYKLHVTLDPDCGYFFDHKAADSKYEITPFFGGAWNKPKLNMGTCGLPIKPIE